MENLNEGKKKKGMAYEAALREIDAQSAVVALEAKIEKLKEMAETKAQRLEMVSEDENLSELIDKKAMNEMRKEIKQIEKMQEKLEKLYEKKNGKMPKAKEVVDEEEKMDENNIDSGTEPKSFLKKKPDYTMEEDIEEDIEEGIEDELKKNKGVTWDEAEPAQVTKEKGLAEFNLRGYLSENKLTK